MSGNRILITGGLGNLGSWLTTHFCNLDYNVTILSKNVNNRLHKIQYKIIKADITDINILKEELYNKEFDYIIHTASYNESFHKNYYKDALLVNTLGTRNLIEIFKNKKIKNFIYLSTFHIYGLNSGNITENSMVNPKNDYASTHFFAESYLKQFYYTHSFPSIIFRLTNSYGSPKFINSNKWYLVLNDLVKSAYIKNKIILKGNGQSIRDFIWMGDVCKVIENSLSFEPNKILNLSSNHIYTILDIANKIELIYKKRYNRTIEIIFNNNDTTPPNNLKVDNSKLKELININFSDKLEYEINNIFNKLELNNGK